MNQTLSTSDGRPGEAGQVTVNHVRGLSKGMVVRVEVGAPGKGGTGGDPVNKLNDSCYEGGVVNRGGAGGGRENLPIIDALTQYAKTLVGTEREPLCFLSPGVHSVDWPYDTPTATLVVIGAGGGGGGGMGGDELPGERGEDGLPGAAFLFPTYLPAQRGDRV